ncbi:excinuclease ABC subunit UvrA [Terricaulis silvestris]|uniref:UvrABC system protein A n=1 Tax=Terricaulis silvestris TaxID=2686094 RepID=A0A6I6MRT6_9CAUL|nr:excinuclease ABC subunit UvrA [Terricaulis silvestris]QGZ95344.1 Excinuclease ABC subunit A [Terricaulis silvestris]
MRDALTHIRVRGAREHNLKGVNVDIPRNELVVITGLSGSGKSSLAFDTIYAEGQRRYVESLSAYARQFLELMQKPDVDSIEGLSPAISIEQKTTSRNPRSTVGTVTEIYDYMRLLWARVGIPYSPATGQPIAAMQVSEMVDRIMALPEGTRLYLLAPVVRDRKGEYKKEMAEYLKKGYQRAKIDGEFYELSEPPTLDKKFKHDIDIVVDRIAVKAGIETRLADSLEQALKLTEGIAFAEIATSKSEDATGKATLKNKSAAPERLIFSQKFACPVSGFTIPEIEPRLFSFNNPAGACPACDGLGVQLKFDPELIVPEHDKTLKEGAVAPWAKGPSPLYAQTLEALAKHFKAKITAPWKDLPKELRNAILHGTKDPIKFVYDDGVRRYETTKNFEGVLPNLERRWKETDSAWVREDLERYQSEAPCPTCEGKRLKPEALAVKVAMTDIATASTLSIRAARDWFGALNDQLNPKQKEIAVRILKEINDRLRFLVDVGLDYLSLGRGSGTLSGGESQRIRLASQIGSGLTGVLYVLDEPSIGLHQRDNTRLLETLRRLRDLGNSVLVVEHDEEAIMTADHVIDMGPAAGIHGGTIIAEGTPADIEKNKNSITGAYLTGRREIPIPEKRRWINKKRVITVKGARGNNLQNIDADIPLGTFTCVTGVSGGGKSTLVIETLYKAVARQWHGAGDVPAEHDKIEGLEHIDKIIDIDQSPIGRTPRSNPATYTGAFTPIRDWYAALPESKVRGYGPGRFSFNVKGGRCEACQGDGVIKIEMHFLPDVYVTCDTCKGKRYNRETLEVLYKGKSISDVLDMTVEEGANLFSAVPSIRDKLETLKRVGLGYVHIGQQATTLSGGEAQRVKLSKELSKRATGRTLYILDEPTTGLHFEDVKKLLEVLHELVDSGNSVLVIEHNLDVIKTADWVIDLGPEGGDGGGKIVALGTPEDVAKVKASHTGRYLAQALKRHGERRGAQAPKLKAAAAEATPVKTTKRKKSATG